MSVAELSALKLAELSARAVIHHVGYILINIIESLLLLAA